jgi:protein-S-isoprenylcysteine O-methyltransferase Ste14
MRPENTTSTGELIQESVDHIREIFRKEILLAKAEAREEATKAAIAGGMAIGAILFGVFTIHFLLWAVVWALAPNMQFWTASLIVSMGTLVLAAALAALARAKFKTIHPKPERAARQLEETIAWAKRQHV